MGWIAYSGSAVVAAFIIHSLLSKNSRARGGATTTPSRSQDHSLQDVKSKSRVILPSTLPTPSLPLLLEVSPPSLALEGKDVSALQLRHNESSTDKPQQASTLMPPPPPRPRSSSPPRLNPPSFGATPAPPRPSNGQVRPPPSAASSLRVPQTKVLANTSMAPSLAVPKKRISKQAILQPGYSPLDWATLTTNPNSNMRGKDAPPHLIKVTPSRLKLQNGRKGRDAWSSFQGKVYNITPYLPFHPGGKGEIMRGAGQDCGKLFMETHPWVNIDMLRECLVGIMVAEDEALNEATSNSGGLDEMD